MHLITGYAGAVHITSANIGEFQGQLTGYKTFTLHADGYLSATKSDPANNNKVTIDKGLGIVEGRVFENAEATDVQLPTMEVGTYERDYIVVRYERDAETGIEEVSLAVKAGTPSTRAQGAEYPTIPTASIRSGDAIVEFPIWGVYRDTSNMTLTRIAKILDADVIDKDYIDSSWGATDIVYGEGVEF